MKENIIGREQEIEKLETIFQKMKAHRLISVIEEGKFMDVRALQFSKSGNNDLSMPAIVKKPKGKKKMLRKRF